MTILTKQFFGKTDSDIKCSNKIHLGDQLIITQFEH